MKKCLSADLASRIRRALKTRNIVFVGMMGSGKSAIGKRLAFNLDLDFIDADQEIEEAANMSIPEMFETFGEEHFRDGERRVIERLMNGGPIVLSTGGGAFMNERTRELVAEKGVSIWLQADFETLMERVRRKENRPLLKTADPEATMRKLLAEREPVYAEADITVASRNESHETVVSAVANTLWDYLDTHAA
ncbi:MAG: shikimate kinase [Pseudomonadota bacterium]